MLDLNQSIWAQTEKESASSTSSKTIFESLFLQNKVKLSGFIFYRKKYWNTYKWYDLELKESLFQKYKYKYN